MTATIKTYNICNKVSGVDLGNFEGATPEEARDAMARDAGYRDAAHVMDVVGGEDDIVIVEVEAS